MYNDGQFLRKEGSIFIREGGGGICHQCHYGIWTPRSSFNYEIWTWMQYNFTWSILNNTGTSWEKVVHEHDKLVQTPGKIDPDPFSLS